MNGLLAAASTNPGVGEFLIVVGLVLGIASVLIVGIRRSRTARRDVDEDDFWKDPRWDRSKGDYLAWQESHLDED